MRFDVVVVGSGISGATLAERFANKLNKKVLLLEKREHIGGNCYDYINKDGILVSKYGPHFFHTNNQRVWEYVSKFTKWKNYEHRVLSSFAGKLVPVPVNITTVNMLLNTKISSEKQMISWLKKNTEHIVSPVNSEESALNRVGRFLYEGLFKGYTKKQWDMWPHQLDAEVMDRIPVRTNYDNRYFTDIYQAMPQDGYHNIFVNMLRSNNITVKLKTDYFTIKDKLEGNFELFFTGPIDQFFNYSLYKSYKLEYRSLNFEYQTLNIEYFQPCAQVNYPDINIPYTRITEPKHATGQKKQKTTIIREYGTWRGDPYYPVPTKRNKNLYEFYKKKSSKMKNIYFVGRLANYKYFNMDQAFGNALSIFDNYVQENK